MELDQRVHGFHMDFINFGCELEELVTTMMSLPEYVSQTCMCSSIP